MITTTNTIEALATVVLGVTSFCIFWYVLTARIELFCDFDCRWSAVFFQ